MVRATISAAAILLSCAGCTSFISATPSPNNDSDYRLRLTNDMEVPVNVDLASQNCASIDSPATFPVNLPANTEMEVHFWRAGNCHGENGQITFSVSRVPGGGATTEEASLTTTIALDYTADGELSTVLTPTWVDDASWYQFYSYVTADSSYLIMHLNTSDNVTLADALNGPCLDADARFAMVKRLFSVPDLGSRTLTTLNKQGPSTAATQLSVTQPAWGFRGLTISDELSYLLREKQLLSKAEAQLIRAADPTDFWTLNGPRLDGASDPDTFAMRVIAITSTSIPWAQTTSVALDYATAEGYAGGGYVYAFQLYPDSQVLGQSTCYSTGGEIQIQPMGGTPIWNILRSDDGVTWEAFINEGWQPTSTIPKNTIAPVNPQPTSAAGAGTHVTAP